MDPVTARGRNRTAATPSRPRVQLSSASAPARAATSRRTSLPHAANAAGADASGSRSGSAARAGCEESERPAAGPRFRAATTAERHRRTRPACRPGPELTGMSCWSPGSGNCPSSAPTNSAAPSANQPACDQSDCSTACPAYADASLRGPAHVSGETSLRPGPDRPVPRSARPRTSPRAASEPGARPDEMARSSCDRTQTTADTPPAPSPACSATAAAPAEPPPAAPCCPSAAPDRPPPRRLR